MILLDTNVISELMRPNPNSVLADWVADLPAATLFTTSITQAEILHGVMLLPAGKRRSAFEAAAEAMFRDDFAGRILAFGSEAAPLYARIAVARRKAGRPISPFRCPDRRHCKCDGGNHRDAKRAGLRGLWGEDSRPLARLTDGPKRIYRTTTPASATIRSLLAFNTPPRWTMANRDELLRRISIDPNVCFGKAMYQRHPNLGIAHR